VLLITHVLDSVIDFKVLITRELVVKAIVKGNCDFSLDRKGGFLLGSPLFNSMVNLRILIATILVVKSMVPKKL